MNIGKLCLLHASSSTGHSIININIITKFNNGTASSVNIMIYSILSDFIGLIIFVANLSKLVP